MIAVCPTCHDAIHHGKLKIDDETVRAWRAITRETSTSDFLLYAEAAPEPKLMTGSLVLTSPSSSLRVFQLSEKNRLSVRILDGDLLQVSAQFSDMEGALISRIVDNNIRVSKGEEIDELTHTGRVRVTAPVSPKYIPTWALNQIQASEPSYCADGRLTVLDVEVLKPGLIRIQGVWPTEEGCIAITSKAIHSTAPHLKKSLALCGQGESTILNYAGPITGAVFGFEV